MSRGPGIVERSILRVFGSDPDAIRAQFEHFYQHHQRKVWP